MKCSLTWRSRFFRSVLLMVVLGFPVPNARAGDPVLDEQEAGHRKLLEQTNAPPRQPPQPARAPSGAAYEIPTQAIAAHDWVRQFALAGRAANALRLSLGAAEKPFVYGPPQYLYVGLQNEDPSARTLDAMPACGSLSRADTLTFRVRSDDGSELVVPNGYGDTEDVHAHPPLVIDGGGSLQGVTNLTDLIGGSAALFDLYERSKSLTVTAEVPALQLHSNTITVPIAGR